MGADADRAESGSEGEANFLSLKENLGLGARVGLPDSGTCSPGAGLRGVGVRGEVGGERGEKRGVTEAGL